MSTSLNTFANLLLRKHIRIHKKFKLILFVITLLQIGNNPNLLAQQPIQVGKIFQVNTNTLFNQNAPSIAMNDIGQSVIIWNSSHEEGNQWAIFGQLYHSDGSLKGEEFKVNTYDGVAPSKPKVAMDESGNFVVVWSSSSEDSNAKVYGQLYDKNGVVLKSKFEIGNLNKEHPAVPAIAMNKDGSFIVVWTKNESYQNIYARRYDKNAQPLQSEFIVNSTRNESYYYPAVAMNKKGEFIIVWTSSPNSNIYGQFYDQNGEANREGFQVSECSYQANPSVAIGEDGRFVIIWDGRKFSDINNIHRPDLNGKYYNSAVNSLGSIFKVNTNKPSLYSTTSQVVMDEDGNFIVVWSSINELEDKNNVLVQSFDNNCRPVGKEFIVSTLNHSPALAMDANGDLTIAGTNFGKDSSFDGVFAQRYKILNNSSPNLNNSLKLDVCEKPITASFEPVVDAVSYLCFIEITSPNGSAEVSTRRIPESSISISNLPSNLRDAKIAIRIAAIFLNENADEVVGEFSDKREFILDCDENLTEQPIVENRTTTDFHLELSPNPVSNELMIQLDNKDNSAVQLEIVDLNGKVLLSQNRTLQQGQNVESISINHLPKGQYFLQIQTKEGTQQAKFIKL